MLEKKLTKLKEISTSQENTFNYLMKDFTMVILCTVLRCSCLKKNQV